MTKAEILTAINTNLTAYMATVEGNKPRVRGMGIYRADENGIIIQTWTIKDIHKQILKNPEIELCFNSKDGKQIRVSGKVEVIDDLALKQEVVAKRPFMKKTVDEKGWGVVAMYALKHGKACVWTMQTNFEPKTYVEL